jgi:3-oxoacyl-[acyl-carrier protein] reductase
VRFSGKRALVTGSSKGIGRATAVALAAEGARVAVHYRGDRAGAEETIALANAAGVGAGGGGAVALTADLATFAGAERLVGEAAAALGGLDVLVANAGHGARAAWNASLDEITEAAFLDVLRTDLGGSFASTRAAARAMGPAGGAIVCVGSIPAIQGEATGIAYGIAKAGVLGATRMLARALAPRVRVNAVALGSIETQWVGWLPEGGAKELAAYIPLGRLGAPAEVARAILFLASSDASFVTGQTLIVDGGEVMR